MLFDVQTETCIREGADCTLVCYGTTGKLHWKLRTGAPERAFLWRF